MNRNLITRVGLASGLVAALVATVFVLLLDAIGAARTAQDDAVAADAVAVAARDVTQRAQALVTLERAVGAVEGDGVQTFDGARSDARQGLRRARAVLRVRAGDGPVAADVAREADDAVGALLAGGARRAEAADRLTSRTGVLETQARELADRRRGAADDAESRATTLAVVGLLGSALLLAALAWYLTRFIVVPLRRVGRASRRLASGDLGARVVEEGDAEPVEIARSFNAMAGSLAQSQQVLEERAAELQRALDDLAVQTRRSEAFRRAGERFAAASTLAGLADAILRELVPTARADAGVLYVTMGDDREVLQRAGALGMDERVLAEQLRAGDGLAGRALESGETVVADRGQGGLRLRALGEDVVARHEAHLPLRRAERVVGVLSLVRAGDDPFVADDLATVERLGDGAAVAAANLWSYTRAVREASINAAVLDATPDPLGLLAPDGTTLVANEELEAVRSQLDGERVDGIAPGERGVAAEVRDELRVGERVLARYAAPVRDADGELLGRVVVMRDVTAERESERLKDEFFALVSHELRTPLTSIIGYLELVLDERDRLPGDAQRFLDVVERNARRLLRLVGDMLFVAQVEAGRLAIEHEPVDLAVVAAESVEAARPSAERRGVRLALTGDAADGGPNGVSAVQGDRDRCGQMIDNLVSNAVKFTPEGGEVSVAVREERDGLAGSVVVEVADTGPGVDPADAGRLFDRFYRARSATAGAVPGVGLGLGIVRTIAEAHGGRVELESQPGEGTTVRVVVPR